MVESYRCTKVIITCKSSDLLVKTGVLFDQKWLKHTHNFHSSMVKVDMILTQDEFEKALESSTDLDKNAKLGELDILAWKVLILLINTNSSVNNLHLSDLECIKPDISREKLHCMA